MKKALAAMALVTSALCANGQEVVHKNEITIAGIECRTINTPQAAPVDIPKLWGQFFEKGTINLIPNKVSNKIYALYCDYDSDHTGEYTVVLGFEVSSTEDLPEGVVAKTLPASNYAVHTAAGEFPKAIIDTWNAIWSSDLPRTFTGDFELYNEDFKPGDAVDIFIATESNA